MKAIVSIRGGGMRSAAYAGMLEAIEDKGIEVAGLIGSSGGSVVASAYATDHKPKDILEIFRNFKPLHHKLNILKSLNLIDANYWLDYSRTFLKDTLIEDVRVKTFIQVYDKRKNAVKYLDKGDFAEAVVLSSNIPGLTTLINDKFRKFYDGDILPEYGFNQFENLEEYILLGLRVVNKSSAPIFSILESKTQRLIDYDKEKYKDLNFHEIVLNLNNQGLFSNNNIDKIYRKGYLSAKRHLDNLEV